MRPGSAPVVVVDCVVELHRRFHQVFRRPSAHRSTGHADTPRGRAPRLLAPVSRTFRGPVGHGCQRPQSRWRSPPQGVDLLVINGHVVVTGPDVDVAHVVHGRAFQDAVVQTCWVGGGGVPAVGVRPGGVLPDREPSGPAGMSRVQQGSASPRLADKWRVRQGRVLQGTVWRGWVPRGPVLQGPVLQGPAWRARACPGWGCTTDPGQERLHQARARLEVVGPVVVVWTHVESRALVPPGLTRLEMHLPSPVRRGRAARGCVQLWRHPESDGPIERGAGKKPEVPLLRAGRCRRCWSQW